MRLAGALAACALGACAPTPPAPQAANVHPTLVSLNPCSDAVLAEVARPWPPVAAVFVFSARHHGAFLELARSQGVQAVEVTVPQVLRRAGEEPGLSAFSGAFLGIRAGVDPASIRPPLLRLLQAGPAAAGGV